MFGSIKYGDLFVRRLWRLIFLAYSMLAVALGASAQSSGSPLSSRVELDALYRGSSDSLINILSEKTGVVISYSNRVYSPAQIALPYKTGTLHQFLNDIFYRFPTKYVEKSGRIIIAPDKTRYFRVSGYCRDSLSNESLSGANVYDTHSYVLDLKELRSHDFDALYEHYAKKYQI